MSTYRNVRLIPGEPEALVISAHHQAGFGWNVKVSVRRQFQLWEEASDASYEGLTTEELVDVIEMSVGLELLS